MVEITTYQEIVDILEKNKEDEQRNHLFLGNGFNYSLKIDTSYKNIFDKMVEQYPAYKEIEDIEGFKANNYDIEALIKKLANKIKKDPAETQVQIDFINKSIKDKITIDFIKATYAIVSDHRRNIYDKKDIQENLSHLFQLCNKYFTLNFDPLLYLSLLKVKKEPIIQVKEDVEFEETIIRKGKYSIDPTFAGNDSGVSPLPTELQKVVERLKKIKEESRVKLISGEDKIEFEESCKETYPEQLKKYLRKILTQEKPSLNTTPLKHLRTSIIDGLVYDEKDKQEEVKPDKIEDNLAKKDIKDEWTSYIDDGFRSTDYVNSPEQNLFYLHGAFHIYKDKDDKHHKTTKQQDSSFNSEINNIIAQKNTDMIYVFQATTEKKKEMIDNDAYLTRSYQDLGQLAGSLLVIGCAFSDNDNHIVDRINQSEIKHIYISHYINEDDIKDEDDKKIKFEEREKELKEKFPQFNVTIFDADTIFKER